MDLATMTKLNENVEAMGKSFEQFKERHEKSLKDKDVLLEETKKQLADLIGEKHEAAMKLISAEVAKFERPVGADSPEVAEDVRKAEHFLRMRQDIQWQAKMAGRDVAPFEVDVQHLKRYEKAFLRWIRYDEKGLSEQERKDMSVGSDPDGGYFAALPTVAANVEQRVFETSPMWELADVMTIGTSEYLIPEDPNDIGVGWVGEKQARTTTQTVQPTRKNIVAQEEYAEPAITQKMMEDSMFDIEKYVTDKLVDKFSRNENTAFVSGNGVNKPVGFLNYALTNITDGSTFSDWNKLEAIYSGVSADFAYASLTKLVTSLKEPFQKNAKFLIRRQSVYQILNLTDNNGRLIFQPLINGNLNQTPLLGYELRYATDMPAAAAGASAMAFGDFKAAYQIVKRVGLSMLRDVYTAKPNVLLYTRKRVGGDVKNFDAIKIYSLQ